jgi:hypothetical protein
VLKLDRYPFVIPPGRDLRQVGGSVGLSMHGIPRIPRFPGSSTGSRRQEGLTAESTEYAENGMDCVPPFGVFGVFCGSSCGSAALCPFLHGYS